MMILLISDEAVESMTANALTNLTQNKISDIAYYFKNPSLKVAIEHLVILDLRANGEFQAMFEAKIFAQRLHEMGLSRSIKTIDLLVSDIGSDDEISDSIPQFAASLANTLQESFQIKVTVRIISDTNFRTTLLVPPSSDTNDEWLIYGINDSLQPQQMNYKKLINYENKNILWQGKDIMTWLNHPQRNFISHVNPLKLSLDG